MKKFIFLFLGILILPGCATYKFHRGEVPYDKGYVVSRDGYTILEYTAGKDNSVPNLQLAKERFKRRKAMVEHYYKKMGYIENRFKMTFWNPPIMLLKAIGGTFRLPFVAISDYKYEHNRNYREKVRKIEEEKEAREELRIEKLKDKLNTYIENVENKLAKEGDVVKPMPVAIEQPVISQKEETVEPVPEKEKAFPEEAGLPVQAEKEPIGARPKDSPLAVIIAKPAKGYAPLTVRFSGSRSTSPYGRIVSYFWDFGDGDTSAKVNPSNTYYSGSFAPQYFTVTLTVEDDKGNIAKATANIEVRNK